MNKKTYYDLEETDTHAKLKVRFSKLYLIVLT